MAFEDLHEGVAELFLEAQEDFYASRLYAIYNSSINRRRHEHRMPALEQLDTVSCFLCRTDWRTLEQLCAHVWTHFEPMTLDAVCRTCRVSSRKAFSHPWRSDLLGRIFCCDGCQI